MIRLVRVEVRRLLSRRAFKLAIVLLLLGTAATLITVAVQSNRDVAAAHALAAQQAHALQLQIAQHGPLICRHGGHLSAAARQLCLPSASDFFQDPRFSFTANATNLLAVAVIAVGLLGLVLGATFIGAEWGAGTFSSLLTWEPRRLRVAAAKMAAVVLVMLAVSVVVTSVFLAGGYLIAATRGTDARTTAGLIRSLALGGLRGLGLVALLTAAGTAIAGLTRSTVAALATGMTYLVGFELVLQHLHPQWNRWLLTTNAQAVLKDRSVDLFVNSPGGKELAVAGHPQLFVLTPTRGAIYLAALVAVLVGAHLAALVRRDAA